MIKTKIDLRAVLHTPHSNFAFALDRRHFVVRLRTAKDDVEKVELVIGNQYLWQTRQEFPMEKIGQDELFDYWRCVYPMDDPRLGYYFLLHKGDETVLYSEAGFAWPDSLDIDHDRDGFIHFQFPYVNDGDIHRRPSWVDGAVFYQIFLDRFCNGDPSLDPEDKTPWGELPTVPSQYGGDLRGLIEKLDYLQQLGANALYLCPIFEARTNHKYDTVDYTRIDPHFGDEDTLRELVQKAHEHGIRIMLDGVFNHCGLYFGPFQDVLKNGENSPYKDWFHIHNFPVTLEPANFEGFAVGCGMPKLNTTNRGLRDYLLGAVEKWTRCGIDAWRLDVADEVENTFWREFRERVRAINPECLIIGECWWNAEPWLKGDIWDGVMNYAVQKACILHYAEDRMNAEEFCARVTECLMRNTQQANECMLNLLDTHDTPRFIRTCGGDKRRVRNAITFQYVFTGMPCTYYGTEIGLDGGMDPDCRRTFDWNEENWDHVMYDHVHTLMQLRRDSMALQSGDIRLMAQDEMVTVRRMAPLQTVVAVINNTEEAHTAQVAMPRASSEVFSGERYIPGEDGAVSVTVPPMSARILVTDRMI